MSIHHLIKEFETKTTLQDVGQILKETSSTFEIKGPQSTIIIQKDENKNTISCLVEVLKANHIKPKGKLKKDLILQVKDLYKTMFHQTELMEQKDDMNESEDEMDISEDDIECNLTVEQAADIFNKLFIEWKDCKEYIIGKINRNLLEKLLNEKIKNKLSYFEKEGYPIKIFTKSRYDEYLMIYYQDGEGIEKQKKITKLTYDDYLHLLN
jgi:light-regulated signal transduction histidine kinase (bacteriophytochrome)